MGTCFEQDRGEEGWVISGPYLLIISAAAIIVDLVFSPIQTLTLFCDHLALAFLYTWTRPSTLVSRYNVHLYDTRQRQIEHANINSHDIGISPCTHICRYIGRVGEMRVMCVAAIIKKAVRIFQTAVAVPSAYRLYIYLPATYVRKLLLSTANTTAETDTICITARGALVWVCCK